MNYPGRFGLYYNVADIENKCFYYAVGFPKKRIKGDLLSYSNKETSDSIKRLNFKCFIKPNQSTFKVSKNLLNGGLRPTISIVEAPINLGNVIFFRNFTEFFIPEINKYKIGFIECDYLIDTQNKPITNVKIQIVTSNIPFSETINKIYIKFENKKYILSNPVDLNELIVNPLDKVVSRTYFINDSSLTSSDLLKFTIGLEPGFVGLVDPWNIFDIAIYYKNTLVKWVTPNITLDSRKLSWSN